MPIIAVIKEASNVRKILDYIGYAKWFYDRFSTGTGRSMGWFFCSVYGRSWPSAAGDCPYKFRLAMSGSGPIPDG
jgi:hypothetical protein